MENHVYMVCGVYKDKDIVIGYRLMRSDGRTRVVDTKQAEEMTDNGIIRNMRIQHYNGEKILRGKGININKLSVYSKEEMKNDTDNKPKNEITRKVVQNGKRVGYEIRDENGSIKIVDIAKVCELVQSDEITNARIKKVVIKGKETIALEGVGLDLNSLDEIVISNGKIVTRSNIFDNTCRVYRADTSGIVEQMKTSELQRFKANDYIAYFIDGKIRALDRSTDIEYVEGTVDSDLNIDKCERYRIKFSSGKEAVLSSDTVKRWKGAKVCK